MTCPLCDSPDPGALPSGRDGRAYFRCPRCDLHFLDPRLRLGADEERARYDLHHADHLDDGYQRFVAPLVRKIQDRVPRGASGLDFGAGRVPVLARLLEARGYRVAIYDAFYWPDVRALGERYEFVVACEVVEHFFEPAREIARIRGLLGPNASLVIMTDPRRDEVDFDGWYYRRDPTHVSFYSARTFRWIAGAFGFKTVEIDHRIIRLATPEA